MNKMTSTKISLTLLALSGVALSAHAQDSAPKTWYDDSRPSYATSNNPPPPGPTTWYNLSDPREVFSSVGVAAGKEGVNLTATFGSYFNGLFKQKVTVQSMNDLDYYNVDYMLVNTNTNAGFSIESSWDRETINIDELDGVSDINDISAGVFSKIPLMENKLNIYPKLNLGMLWGNDVQSTTYVAIEAPIRLSLSDVMWVGATPTYTYAMQGYDINDWRASVDAGIQFSSQFAVAGHLTTDDEFWVDLIFTF